MGEKAEAAEVRRAIRDALGRDTLSRLHKENRLLDVLAIIAPPVLLVSFVWGVTALPFGVWWCLCFVGVPWTLLVMALVSHDLFVHRRVGGERFAWIASICFTVPRFSSPTGYEQAHLRHHRFIGTEKDSEIYKQDLSTIGRRLWFSTFPGILMTQAGRFAPPEQLEQRRHYRQVDSQEPAVQRRVRIEKRIQRAYLVGLLVFGAIWPRPVFFGFLLPLLTVGPVLNTVRIVLEHADVDPNNPYHLATFYRAGPLMSVLFLWGTGDGHLVHHLFERIPYYRTGEAARLMRPLLVERGVIERRSLWRLLLGWYSKGYAHRSLWPL